jgi:hypothetical protein
VVKEHAVTQDILSNQRILLNKELARWFGNLSIAFIEEAVTNRAVHNLASGIQMPDIEELLSYGFKFCPTPALAGLGCLDKFMNKLKSRLYRTLNFFRLNPEQKSKDEARVYDPRFKLDSPSIATFTPYKGNMKEKGMKAAVDQFIKNITSLPQKAREKYNEIKTNPALRLKRNFSFSQLQTAISTLLNNDTLIVKPADKNMGLCIMEKTWYKQTMLNTLQDINKFLPLSFKEVAKIVDDVRDFIEHGVENYHGIRGRNAVIRFLKENPAVIKPAAMYGLFKIHKLPTRSLRLIAPNHSWVTVKLSRWLAYMLQEIVDVEASILSGSHDFLKTIETTPFPKEDLWFLTFDVVDLYGSIPHTIAIDIVYEIAKDQVGVGMAGTIKTLLLVVLNNNIVEFDRLYYKQLLGIAMGTACAPAFANLFMTSVDKNTRVSFSQNIKCYRRYLDDGCVILHGSRDRVQEVMDSLINNQWAQYIKFTYTISEKSAVFLDLVLYKGPRYKASGLLDVRMYQKALNAYQYIPFKSYHQPSTIKGWVKGELKRIIRTHTEYSKCVLVVNLFLQRLLARGYRASFVKEIAAELRYQDRVKYIFPEPKISAYDKDTIFVTLPSNPLFEERFYPCRAIIASWFNSLKRYDPFKDKRLKVVFTRAKTLGQYLSRAKF